MRELFSFLILALFSTGSLAQWPGCKELRVDYSGFNYDTLYSYSAAECARWCTRANDNGGVCSRWVFAEAGSTCKLKLADVAGDRRDTTDPLTAEDKAEFAPDGNATTTTTVSPAKSERINMRLEELENMHTGLSACTPGEPSTTILSSNAN